MSHNHTILGQMLQMFSRFDFQKAVKIREIRKLKRAVENPTPIIRNISIPMGFAARESVLQETISATMRKWINSLMKRSR